MAYHEYNRQARKNTPSKTQMGKWSDLHRVALELNRVRFGLQVIPESVESNINKGEVGPEILVTIQRDARPMTMSLTYLTHAELGALAEFWKIAIANAQDICAMRDQIAKEALENGDDSYIRIYRRVPEILIREGEKWPDYPRIRRGFEWITQLVPEFITTVRNLRGTGSSVPEPQSQEPVSLDD